MDGGERRAAGHLMCVRGGRARRSWLLAAAAACCCCRRLQGASRQEGRQSEVGARPQPKAAIEEQRRSACEACGMIEGEIGGGSVFVCGVWGRV